VLVELEQAKRQAHRAAARHAQIPMAHVGHDAASGSAPIAAEATFAAVAERDARHQGLRALLASMGI